jgi:hypothetical protein
VLEDQGFERLLLANPVQVKALAGRKYVTLPPRRSSNAGAAWILRRPCVTSSGRNTVRGDW